MLHDCCCDTTGQAVPPKAGAVSTRRDCTWVPPLHDLEHGVHADHPPTTQLTGQGWVLHGCVCDKTGHPLPPKATLRTTDRVCVCEPPPQVLEHADHDDQPLTSQLTGQGCVLHACDSDKAGHATPPWAAAVMTDRL